MRSTGRLYAFDVSAKHVAKAKPRFACSGVGTLRRNPDRKWRQHPGSLTELCDLQRRILASASRCVALGGRLVYATCSVLPEENQARPSGF